MTADYRDRSRYMRLYYIRRRERLTGQPYRRRRDRPPPEKPCTKLRAVNPREYMRLYMRWWRYYGNVNDEAEKWCS